MSEAMIGHSHQCTFVPGLQQTAAAIGNADVHVISTPALIAMLEETAGSGVQAFNEPGWGTVGTRVDIEHSSPAWPDIEVQCEAVLVSTKGRTLRFAVRAIQQGRLVMTGHHERAKVDLSRFSAPISSKLGSPIEFYFDFHSPWCYLAIPRLREIAASQGRDIHWRPMHLANLIDRIGGRRPLESSTAFVRWFQQDLQDWARKRRLSLSYHPRFPLRPSRALRCSLYAIEQGKGAEFIFSVMKAYWGENRDISELDVIGDLAAAVGLDREASVQAAADDRFKHALEANNDEAVQYGVFGAPTVIADSKLFWGNDRLEMLSEYLADGNEKST
jgi:2-hydroxychromene-2-carboxylate isomerase